jgi:hypothetical protein
VTNSTPLVVASLLSSESEDPQRLSKAVIFTEGAKNKIQRYAAVALLLLLLLALCVSEGWGQSCAFPEGLVVTSCSSLAAAVAARESCVQVTASMLCSEDLALSSETVMDKELQLLYIYSTKAHK